MHNIKIYLNGLIASLLFVRVFFDAVFAKAFPSTDEVFLPFIVRGVCVCVLFFTYGLLCARAFIAKQHVCNRSERIHRLIVFHLRRRRCRRDVAIFILIYVHFE